MAQVQYKSEKVHKKSVWYSGSSLIKTGYPLCYDFNTDSGGSGQAAWKVEKPITANLKYFAGVVAEGYNVTGPAWVEVIQPTPFPGTLAKVWTNISTTGGTDTSCTELGLKTAVWTGSTASSSQPYFAKAAQTVNRSSTAGTVLAHLVSEGQVDTVTATQTALTGGSTGETTVITGTTAAIGVDIPLLGGSIEAVRVDVAAIITAMKKSGRMNI